MRARVRRDCLCRVGAGCQYAECFILFVSYTVRGLTPTYRVPDLRLLLLLCVYPTWYPQVLGYSRVGVDSTGAGHSVALAVAHWQTRRDTPQCPKVPCSRAHTHAHMSHSVFHIPTAMKSRKLYAVVAHRGA